MDQVRQLADYIRAVQGKRKVWVTQGIVKAVNSIFCDVEVGDIIIPSVRLRASETELPDKHILLVPKVGSAVTVGSLSGDLDQLVVLQTDELTKIIINADEITLNKGTNEGLVTISKLTEKLNQLVNEITALKNELSAHTHTDSMGSSTTPPITPIETTFSQFDKSDYEDTKIKH